jgi:allantoinase
MSQVALHSKRVVTPQGMVSASIVIEEGTITDVTRHPPRGIAVEDFGTLVLMPGLVDTHVHINEPARTAWEGFETATRAAAAGGITTLVDMPLNSSPVTTTPAALQEKRAAARGKLWVECGFYAGLVPGNTAELEGLIEAGVLGVKAFLIDSGIDEFPSVGEKDLRAAMPILAHHGLPLLVHCELNSSRAPLPPRTNQRSYKEYLLSRPRKFEEDAIELIIRLCREYRTRTHIVHLSSSDTLPMIRQARSEKLPLTVETCPHYLYFCAEEIPDGDTRYKCAPPIRERENREYLWNALKEGVLDFIVSDHSPCPPDMKALEKGDFVKAWGGIASLQFGLPIVWTQARTRGHTIEEVVRWMSHTPAAFIGLETRKGALAPGMDADIVVWNPEAEFTLSSSMIHHRHKLTPYEGRTFAGEVVRTYVRGSIAFDRGMFSETPHGTFVARENPA